MIFIRFVTIVLLFIGKQYCLLEGLLEGLKGY